VGPVADDGVVIEELRYRRLNNQYFFGTERAISYLKVL